MWERVRELWLSRSSVVRRGRGEGGWVRPLLLHVTWLAWVGRRRSRSQRRRRRRRRRIYLADTVLGTGSLQGAAGLLAGQPTVSGAEDETLNQWTISQYKVTFPQLSPDCQ